MYGEGPAKCGSQPGLITTPVSDMTCAWSIEYLKLGIAYLGPAKILILMDTLAGYEGLL